MTHAENPDSSPPPNVDAAVADRIVTELGEVTGERVMACLRTAQELLRLDGTLNDGLRLAASAAYNVREALDSVVRDRPAAGGGLKTALEAWKHYKLSSELPGADEPSARRELASVLDGLARVEARQAFMTRKLLEWFHHRTSVAPLPGVADTTLHYQRLRDDASTMLHSDAAPEVVRALYAEAVDWFARFFAPPSDIAGRLEALAGLPYTADRMVELQSLAQNSHHLRLFLQRLADPGWLEPVRRVGLLGLPVAGEPWPVAALTGDGRRVADEAVAHLLEQMVDELVSLPKDDRPNSAFEIARTAWWLGAAGYSIVVGLLQRFPRVHGIQVMAGSVSDALDASESAQYAIADALIGNEAVHLREYATRRLIAKLVDGMNSSNAEARFGLITLKLDRLARPKRYLALDIAALSMDCDDESEISLYVAHSLALAIPRARSLGVASTTMLTLVTKIDGELGERLACQVLAGASDIERRTKVLHLAARLASHTATGDDRALIEDLNPLDNEETALLSSAFGTRSATRPDMQRIDDDSARAWRWSMLLPVAVLAGWTDAIYAVTSVHGTPDVAVLDRRTPMSGGFVGRSPIPTEELAALEPIDAAALAARWRPQPDDAWGVSARELARTIEAIAKAHPQQWTNDPVAMVRALREPVYIDHYLRALAASTDQIRDRAHEVLNAVRVVTSERWNPAIIGRDDFDFEADWSHVDASAVELIDALADADADLTNHLDECWRLALRLVNDRPEDLGSPDLYVDTDHHTDPLHHAINSSHGRGLQAAIALGGWEFRNEQVASERLAATLSSVLGVQGAVGLQLRAVIAASRPFVEAIAADWLNKHDATLFGDSLGAITFDQTLKYSRPTRIFFDRSHLRLVDAARRGAHNAVTWMLIAHLQGDARYSFESVVRGLAGCDAALAETALQVARLCADVSADEREITERGFAFWEGLLGEAGRRVPVAALEGLGGWALGTNVDPVRWLELTERTTQLTEGAIAFPSEVAERCRDLQPSPIGLRVIAAILGHGDRWEQYHVEDIGVGAPARSCECRARRRDVPLPPGTPDSTRSSRRGRRQSARLTSAPSPPAIRRGQALRSARSEVPPACGPLVHRRRALLGRRS